MILEGAYTALVTPFNSDESIDEDALRDLVRFQVAEGIAGIVPMGTTGESPTLNHEEHIRVIEIVIEEVNGRIPVIAGTGSNCTREAIEMTRHAMECGADYSLQVAPYYNKPTQEGFIRHFRKIADSVDIPLILYNIPGRTGKNMTSETILSLANHPNIIGVKEASGDMNQVMDIIAGKSDDFFVISGDDSLTLPICRLGGTGVISVASNLFPAKIQEFAALMNKGKTDEARKMHYQLLPLFRILFIETNPIPVKFALSLSNKVKEAYRLPLCPMSDANKKIFLKTFKNLKL